MKEFFLQKTDELISNTPLSKAALLLKRPRRVSVEINRRWYQYRYGDISDEFLDGSWDNLIILDAARPEILREVFDKGTFETRYSPASYSLEFMRRVYGDRSLHDTVYVTSNPYASSIPEGIFHSIINLFDNKFDSDKKTVTPETVVESAIQAAESYPDKRLIIHFMQPHFPFLGPTKCEFDSGMGDNGDHPWNRLMWNKDGDPDSVVQSYRENHSIVANSVNKILNEINGQSVITADHANLVGERGFPIPLKLYGHIKNFPHPNLLRVPWITVSGDRRIVTEAKPEERSQVDDAIVEQRLRDLGYTESE